MNSNNRSCEADFLTLEIEGKVLVIMLQLIKIWIFGILESSLKLTPSVSYFIFSQSINHLSLVIFSKFLYDFPKLFQTVINLSNYLCILDVVNDNRSNSFLFAELHLDQKVVVGMLFKRQKGRLSRLLTLYRHYLSFNHP